MQILGMIFFFLLTSCSLFKGQVSLEKKPVNDLLNAVRLTGEGKGRLTLNERQFVFGVDSVLKENQDWILAVSIPLQGEEVMVLPNLKKEKVVNDEMESFERRIQNEFRHLKVKKNVTGKKFLTGLRSMIRFVLAPAWGQQRNCREQEQDVYLCTIETEDFLVKRTKKDLTITKKIGDGNSLQLVAKNLTETFFTQNTIGLLVSPRDKSTSALPVSLELFW